MFILVIRGVLKSIFLSLLKLLYKVVVLADPLFNLLVGHHFSILESFLHLSYLSLDVANHAVVVGVDVLNVSPLLRLGHFQLLKLSLQFIHLGLKALHHQITLCLKSVKIGLQGLSCALAPLSHLIGQTLVHPLRYILSVSFVELTVVILQSQISLLLEGLLLNIDQCVVSHGITVRLTRDVLTSPLCGVLLELGYLPPQVNFLFQEVVIIRLTLNQLFLSVGGLNELFLSLEQSVDGGVASLKQRNLILHLFVIKVVEFLLDLDTVFLNVIDVTDTQSVLI